MSAINDGGPAFPRMTEIEAPHTIGHMSPQFSRVRSSEGMSLRDWFAGQALMGRMINGFASSADKEIHARVAYDIADAMLAVRQKDDQP